MTDYWFNTKTGKVEEGMLSPSVIRIGPFSNRHDAAHAWDIVNARAAAWAAEDAAEEQDRDSSGAE